MDQNQKNRVSLFSSLHRKIMMDVCLSIEENVLFNTVLLHTGQITGDATKKGKLLIS